MNNIDKTNKSISDIASSLLRLTISVQETIQSSKELAAEIKAIEDKYHPLVRWLYKLGIFG